MFAKVLEAMQYGAKNIVRRNQNAKSAAWIYLNAFWIWRRIFIKLLIFYY